jgi:hypothetical protein
MGNLHKWGFSVESMSAETTTPLAGGVFPKLSQFVPSSPRLVRFATALCLEHSVQPENVQLMVCRRSVDINQRFSNEVGACASFKNENQCAIIK